MDLRTEFGFDYLRDELKASTEERINPDRHVILLEDAYTTLLHEGRTPLIIASRDEMLYEKQAGLTEPGKQETMDAYEDFDLDVVRIRTI